MTLTLTVLKFPNEGNYPAIGAADTLYTNAVNDVIKYWDATLSSYAIYIGPRPHK